MNQYLKDQIPTFLVGALVAVLLFVVLRKKSDSNTEALTDYQLNQLKTEMKGVILHEFDSLSKAVQVEIPIPNDSLQQVAIDLNKKIINEIRKKRLDNIDTVSGEELRRIFASYRRQHDMPSN